MVLLHGFASATDIWRGTERYLLRRGFQPIAVEWSPRPGDEPGQVAIEVLLPAIDAALRVEGYPEGSTFDVIAHSMAGLLMRSLLEQAPLLLAERVRSLVMISTPNRGARTGVARFACGSWKDPAWRAMACSLTPDSTFVRSLGDAKPAGTSTRYLAIGADGFHPMVPVPAYDGDGDGAGSGHDKAVMAEAVFLRGAPFVIWRGWGRLSDHFGVTCAQEVNRWAADFIELGVVPVVPPGRQRTKDLCRGIPKRGWRPGEGG